MNHLETRTEAMECLKYVYTDSSIQTTTEWMTQQQYAYTDGNLSQTGKCSLALILSSWWMMCHQQQFGWLCVNVWRGHPDPPPPQLRGGGVTGVILVWVCEPVFQNLPHSYTWPLKITDPFIYFIRNVDLFIYCPLIFCTHLLLVVRPLSHSIHWIPREQAASKNLWVKKYVHIPGCQKSGAFNVLIQKNLVIHILFVEKRGPIIYLAGFRYISALANSAPTNLVPKNIVLFCV